MASALGVRFAIGARRSCVMTVSQIVVRRCGRSALTRQALQAPLCGPGELNGDIARAHVIGTLSKTKSLSDRTGQSFQNRY